jgi:hypothetical protein
MSPANNHTDIAAGADADNSTFNDPLGQLDAAIGAAVSTLNTAAKTLVGATNEVNTRISGSVDADGTLKAGAVDGSTVITDGVVTDAKMATDAKVGSLATLGTPLKSSIIAALGTAIPTTVAKSAFGAINELKSLISLIGTGGQKIYGVLWDKSSNPVLTRTDSAVGMVAAAGVDAGIVTNDFDSAEIYRDIVEVTDSYGNVFVRIPSFYIEKTSGAMVTWRISKISFGSAYMPKCFIATDGSILPYVDVGKYNASLSTDTTRIESKAETFPLINKTIAEFRTYASANRTDYQQLDVHIWDVLQVLFLVEFATLNSQSIMAGWSLGNYTATYVATVAESAVNRIILANANAAHFAVGMPIAVGTALGGNQRFYGRLITAIDVYDGSNKAISFDGAPVNISIGDMLYNTGWKSGFSSAIVAKSGGPVSLSSGVKPCMYRGIENPWGSVWQWADGLNVLDNHGWVCADQKQFASDLFAAPYEVLAYVNGNANGYISALGYDPAHPGISLPTGVIGSATTYYSDSYYQTTGGKVACIGGSHNLTTPVGLFCKALHYPSTLISSVNGARLCRKASTMELSGFNIVELPDEHMRHTTPSLDHFFTDQTAWLAANAARLNIKFVTQIGDVVDDTTGGDSYKATEYVAADAGITALGNSLPFMVSLGNHDSDLATGHPEYGRNTTLFNGTFPQARYTSMSWWSGGFYEGSKTDNAYYLATIAGIDYLFLSIECGPRQEVVDWAITLCGTTYPNRKVILLTHAFTFSKDAGGLGGGTDGDGHPATTGDEYETDGWTGSNHPATHNGLQLWNELVKTSANIILVISGHHLLDGFAGGAHSVAAADDGHKVVRVIANYQVGTNAGSGYFRIYNVDPVKHTISWWSYSPALNSWLTDAENQCSVSTI